MEDWKKLNKSMAFNKGLFFYILVKNSFSCYNYSMNILNANKNFKSQFDFNPVIENKEKLEDKSAFVVVGMGGSHLAADLIKLFYPEENFVIHSNYDLPKNFSKDALVILSSFSGNTEEVLSAFDYAFKNNFSMAIIVSGGELLKLAKQNNLPYIELPEPDMQPRSALGYSFTALLKIIGKEKQAIDFNEGVEEDAKAFAKGLKKTIPIIYASEKNKALAYIWKINFNETGKTPAFYNVFPELNHNEMISFENEKDLSKYHFIILKDEDDHPRIKLRMEILEKLCKGKGFSVTVFNIDKDDIWNSILFANWAADYLALEKNLKPDPVNLVEEFKKML